MQDYTIIVAGGVGNRMGSPLPKQFIEVCGMPIIMHTIKRFAAYNPSMKFIIVIHPDYLEFWEDLCENCDFCMEHEVVMGGEERFYSVKNGLDAISSKTGIVAIHDAVRPFVSVETLDRCFSTARAKGNAIPTLAVHDSMRKLNKAGSKVVNRSEYLIVQTPQCFEISELRKAYQQEYSPEFTDDATVYEALGENILHFVDGNRDNLKITSPSDLNIACALLED